MLLLRDKIAKLFEEFHAEWNNVLQAPPAAYKEWCMEVPSKTAQNIYNWVMSLVRWREWLGPRHMQHLKAAKLTVVNRDFEASFPLSKNDIEDDQIGLFKPSTVGLVNSGFHYFEELAQEALNGGFTETCYDGQLFFDADHPYEVNGVVGTWSNKGTEVFDYDALADALDEYPATVKLPNGQPFRGLKPYAVCVGPSNIRKAKQFYENEQKPGGSGENNELRNRVKPVLMDNWVGADAGKWAVLFQGPDGVVRPVAIQMRKQPTASTTYMNQSGPMPEFESEDNHTFEWNEIKFGGHARGEAFLTFPHLAYGSDGSGA